MVRSRYLLKVGLFLGLLFSDGSSLRMSASVCSLTLSTARLPSFAGDFPSAGWSTATFEPESSVRLQPAAEPIMNMPPANPITAADAAARNLQYDAIACGA